MVDIFNPEKFREFEGDLIPTRIKQIQDQRKKENEAKLQRQNEYERKMSEQREKEREMLRKKREEPTTEKVEVNNNSKLVDLEYDNVELTEPEMKNEPLEKKVGIWF